MEEGDDGVWRASKSVNLGNAAVLEESPAAPPQDPAASDPDQGVPAPESDAGGR
jgi:Mce-associated membrane protein